jgi:Skp family chaperone for outer membrane proteins
MKRYLVIAAAALLSVASLSASAQTRPAAPGAATPKPTPVQPAPSADVPAAKIAVIDTGAFGDEKVGITRYINAVKTLEREFQPRQAELTNLQTRIKAIADEITKLSGNPVVAPDTIRAKQVEGEDLQRTLKYKKDQADADFAKRYTEAVGPVSNAIGKALDVYALQHGITIVFDISKLLPAVLTMHPAVDVTKAFITDYNSKNP